MIRSRVKGLALCFLFVSLFAGFQFLLAQAPALLGVSSEALSAGFAQFDIGTVLVELGKVFGVMTFYFYFLHRAYIQYSRKLARPAALYLWRAVTCLMVGCIYLSTCLRYPAAFEGFLPLVANRTIYRMAFWLSPRVLEGGVLLWVVWVALHGSWRWKTALVAGSIWAGISAWSPSLPVSAPPEGRPPDVFLLAVDALRVDRAVSSRVMPHLNQEAAASGFIQFQNHIVGIPRTFPSWIEMIQGKPAAQTGIRHMFPDLKDKRPFFSGIVSLLQEGKYHTGVVSDFAGDIFPRFQAGFDVVDAPTMTIQSLLQMSVDLTFPAFLPFVLRGPASHLFPAVLESPSGSNSEELVARAIRLLRKNSTTEPTFLTLFFSTVHFPYAAPWPWYTKYTDPTYAGPYFFQKNPDLYERQEMSEADKKQVHALYDGAAAYVDASIATFIAELKRQHRWDASLVLLTADHGQELFEYGSHNGHGEHVRGEDVIKVPFWMKLPKSFPTLVREMPFVTRSIDMAPTIYGVVYPEAPMPEIFQGKNLVPFVYPVLQDPHLYAYTESGLWFSRVGATFYQKERLDYPSITELLQFNPAQTGDIVLRKKYKSVVITAKHRCITTERFKLIYLPTYEEAQMQLYDRLTDPKNEVDVQKQYPKEFEEMKQILFHWIEDNEPHASLVSNFVVPQGMGEKR